MSVSRCSNLRSEEIDVLIGVSPRQKVLSILGLLLVQAFHLASAFQALFGGEFSWC